MAGYVLPMLMGAQVAVAGAGCLSMLSSGGMNSCCNGMLGTPERGAMTGLLGGSLTGLLFSGGNPLGALLGGGIGAAIGALVGRHNERNCHHHNPHGCHNFPPPYGGGWGGPQCGGYAPGQFGPQYPGCYPGAYPQGFMPPYQMGYQNGYAYGQGYQAGYQAGMQGMPGCMPPGGQWNNGCCPQQMCFPPGSTGNPGGHLCQEKEGGPINYRTSGGWGVQVNGDKVIITSPDGKQKIEHSGDPHEYVNGKHIKDWEGKQRTLVLPDGTKITMGATGPQGVVENTSIYDGDQNIQIRNKGNEVTHRSFNPWDTRAREAYQYDGETAGISQNRDGGLNYTNFYTQDQNFGIRSNYKELAGTERKSWWDQPFTPFWNRGFNTYDRYNDPRLLFT